MFELAFAFPLVLALLVVKSPFPRRFKALLVAFVSLVAVTVMSVAPTIRPRAQSLPPSYTFTDLTTLGGTYSKAYGINNCGQVVGESSLSGTTPTHPFLWRDANGNLTSDAGEMKDLGTLGGSRGIAFDINASGLVVGNSTISLGEQHAFRWFDQDGDGVPDPGELMDLGLIPGYSTHSAFGVNDNGQIVGSAENSEVVASGFIWNANTGFQVLATLNGITPSHGQSINNSSHIAGYAALSDRAFIFDGTTNITLGTFGGNRSIAYDINASGHAVGFATVDAGGSSWRAFKWNGSALENLGVLTGGGVSEAYSINSSGTVVGSSQVTGGARHAFMHDGTIYDLNSFTTLPPGWTLVEARGINDAGQIVGFGTTPGGDTHAFLLTPTTYIPTCSPTVTVSVAPASVSEDGPTPLIYTFTRAPVTTDPLTVNFSTSGTATAAVDYAVSGTGVSYDSTLGAGSVTFGAGEVTKSVTVDPATDSTVEPNETVTLTTTSGTGYIVGSPTFATGTITNDDSIPTVSVSVSPAATLEDGAANLVYTFTRSNTTNSPLDVKFAVTGTATSGGDYAILPAGTVTIPAGSPSATATVDPIADTQDEPDETVILTISADPAYTIAASPLNSAEGTITDDDGVPTIQITNVTAPEPPTGSSTFVFTVSLTNPSSSQITLNYATATTGATTPATGGAGCNAGIDFVDAAGALTFAAGETSKQVNVTVCGDSSLEPDETFFVNLSGNSANSVLPANTKGTGTITPQAPIVFTEEGNGNFAVAIDSVTFVKGPFKLTNEWNLTPSDRATRVILITSILGMTDADLASGILSIHIAGYGQIPLANIEHVGAITGVAGLSASYITVKLPANLPNPNPGPNNLTLTVKMGSATSNATIISITP